ncbi:hypothetical protein PARMER_04158 [Parabacteroides merdae ATCC 43184]|nr:hypothetical protein PARMER_04158 [Parabacteroides merdae ATCC 43184]
MTMVDVWIVLFHSRWLSYWLNTSLNIRKKPEIKRRYPAFMKLDTLYYCL